jgi:hypothetical protein
MRNYFAKIMFTKVSLLILILAVFTFVYSRSAVNSGPKENEAFAVKSIETIRKLQNQYAKKHDGKFAPNFDELITIENLDARFSGETPIVEGYAFRMIMEEMRNEKPAIYLITADPDVTEGSDRTGNLHFYYDSTLKTIKFTNESRSAKADDPSL